MSNSTHSDTIGFLLGSAESARTVTVRQAALAATVDAESPIFVAPVGNSAQNIDHIVITRVTVVPSVAITGAPTDTHVFTIKRYTSAGVNVTGALGVYNTTVSVGLLATKVVSTTAFKISPGDVLTIAATHTGAGAATPELTFSVDYVVEATID